MKIPQSLLNELELLRALRGRLVSLSGLRAAVEEVDALRRLLAGRLWTWESAVTSCYLTESSLTPLELRSTALLDTLDSVDSVLTSRWAIAHHFTWHLDHDIAPQRLTTTRPPMTRI